MWLLVWVDDTEISSSRKRKQDVQTVELEQKHEKLDSDIGIN